MSLLLIKQIAFYAALVVWLAAYFIYLASYAAIMLSPMWIWTLHVLVILVWLPIVFDLKNITPSADASFTPKTSKIHSLSLFRFLFAGTPSWFIALIYIGFLISVESLVTFLFRYRGSTEMINGEYFLNSLGNPAGAISKGEYNFQKAIELRGHAGHWLLFSGLAVGILFKYKGFTKINKN